MASFPEQAAKRHKGGASAVQSSNESSAAGLEWHVHKFGGTSVGDAKCFRRVQEIISQVNFEGIRPAIVVSAMGGKPKTTDMLIQLTVHAAENDWEGVQAELCAIRSKHETCLRELFGEGSAACTLLTAAVEKDLEEIVNLLRAVSVMREAPESIVGIVSGYGEQWSAQFLHRLLADEGEPWVYLDARQVLVVDSVNGSDVAICWAESAPKVQKFLDTHTGHNLVITGFIASTRTGGSTTLGRDGSDFSATVFGRLLGATEVTIWTDVSGVLSADPRKVPDAYSLPAVSYKEAAELAFFGAKVVHPKTMIPAYARSDRPSAWGAGTKSIPIYIKNTFAPKDPGTRIFETSKETQERPEVVCGFTAADNMTLISVEGLGMQGCPGVASRLFNALQSAGISIVLIAQASSEMSICYLVQQKDGDRAKAVTMDAFARELKSGSLDSVDVTSPCTVLAAVGDSMPHTAGVCGKFFDALGQAGVNVLAIAQGRNQRNISAVVAAADSNRALQALHAAFLTIVPLAVGVIGAGGIAEAFLKCIASRAQDLAQTFGVDLRVVAIWDPLDRTDCAWQGCAERRGKAAWSEPGERLDLDSVLSKLAEHGTDTGVDALVDRLARSPLVHKIIVDCSDSRSTPSNYKAWVAQGFHVVSQNHLGYMNAVFKPEWKGSEENSDGLSYRGTRLLGTKLLSRGSRILCGAAVGRGLPILPTLNLLRESGDPITLIDGIFSLSGHYICTRVSPADGSQPVPFGEAVASAAKLGFLEKQEELDMKGLLAKLQLVLLGQQLKGSTEAKIDVEHLTEAALSAGERDPGSVLRYAGSLDVESMRGSVRLVSVPREHPFAQLPGGFRMTRFFTQKRGPESPVTVSGPVGCGLVGDALLADCLQLARRFGAQEAQADGGGKADGKLQALLRMRNKQSHTRITELGA